MALALSAINTGVIITLLLLATVVSIILGAIAWSRTVSLFLPFPASLSAISTFYPILPYLAVAITNIIASRVQQSNDSRKTLIASSPSDGTTADDNHTRDIIVNSNRYSSRKSISYIYPFIASAVDQLMTILPTVIATLAATYIAPSDNNCHIEQKWQSYYHNKDVNAIRTIQDKLQCCGLRSTRDRAWPFKDATHGDDACERTMGYQQSCLQSWSEQEKRIAVLVFASAVIGWGIKLSTGYLKSKLFYSLNHGRNAWFNRVNSRHNVRGESTGPRLLPYSDVAYENSDGRDEEEAADDGLPIGTSPLINPDSRDLSSPEGRDLTGSDPWRNNV